VTELEALRAQIDTLDDALIALVAERARVAIALGRAKSALGRPLRDETREAQVRARLTATAPPPLEPSDVEALQTTLTRICLRAQTQAVEVERLKP
jgi:chorismate mutase/prephenate dehydratase